jgi:ribosomal protein L33
MKLKVFRKTYEENSAMQDITLMHKDAPIANYIKAINEKRTEERIKRPKTDSQKDSVWEQIEIQDDLCDIEEYEREKASGTLTTYSWSEVKSGVGL